VEMNSTKFRKELIKIMPGYKWTVHRKMFKDSKYFAATGIQTAGFNRLSTLEVVVSWKGDVFEYEVKSSGFGLNAPWLSTNTDATLARALRGLQNHYEATASMYNGHAYDLKAGRIKKEARP